jgi:hypothetical protein
LVLGLSRLVFEVRGTQLKDAWRDASDVDMTAGLKPGLLQPPSHQAYLGFEQAVPTVTVFLDLQSADPRFIVCLHKKGRTPVKMSGRCFGFLI